MLKWQVTVNEVVPERGFQEASGRQKYILLSDVGLWAPPSNCVLVIGALRHDVFKGWREVPSFGLLVSLDLSVSLGLVGSLHTPGIYSRHASFWETERTEGSRHLHLSSCFSTSGRWSQAGLVISVNFRFFPEVWSVGAVHSFLGCWVSFIFLASSGSDALHYRTQSEGLWVSGFRRLHREWRALSHDWKFFWSLGEADSKIIPGPEYPIQSYQTNEIIHLKSPPIRATSHSWDIEEHLKIKRLIYSKCVTCMWYYRGACVLVYVCMCGCAGTHWGQMFPSGVFLNYLTL